MLYIDGVQSFCSRFINARHLYAIDMVEGSFDRHLENFDMFFYPGEKSTSLIALFSFYIDALLVINGYFILLYHISCFNRLKSVCR